MTFKQCTCCKRQLTTKQVKKIASGEFIGGRSLYVNCRHCGSTLVMFPKKSKVCAKSVAV